MSQAVHVIAGSLAGCVASEGRCLPSSGFSASAVTLSSCSSLGDNKIHPQLKVAHLKCSFRGRSILCKANSGGHRRHPDFSRLNKYSFSRNKNRQSDQRERFENLDDSEVLSSKNGLLLSLSGTPKSQATAGPGPREKEIVELFRKVQTQLRERAAAKDKKIEGLQAKGKESETVDSLLKLLRKHSVEQGRRKGNIVSNNSVINGDLSFDQPEQNSPDYEDKISNILGSNSGVKDGSQEPKASTFARPPSSFRRKSPVPQVKYQPFYLGQDALPTVSRSERKKKVQGETPDPESQPALEAEAVLESEADVELGQGADSDLELEPEMEFKDEDVPADDNVFDEASDDESLDVDESFNCDDLDEEEETKDQDLSALKLTELRALAKSRGLKGFSKMKKSELVELISATTV